MPPAEVDLAILGSGLSGSLALLRIAATGWARDRTVVLIDRQPEPLTGRAWGYWSAEPVVPGADGSVWSRLVLRDTDRAVAVKLHDVHYRRLAGDRLSRRVREDCDAAGIRRVVAEVTAVRQADDRRAAVHLADGSILDAGYVLDSTRALPARPDAPALEFLGYRLPTGTVLPDWGKVTLMDLRVPQRDGVRFVYIVPGQSGGGLVEYSSFLPRGGHAGAARQDLHAWLSATLGGPAARAATRVEAGRYPLVRPGRRRLSASVMLIGLGAGCVRPSTGYGVVLMARDAQAMARSLERDGHPFAPHPLTRGQRWLDRVFLRVMRANPEIVRAAYLDMFERAGGDDVLRFLNGEMPPRRLARVIRSMPQGPFVRAAVGLRP